MRKRILFIMFGALLGGCADQGQLTTNQSLENSNGIIGGRTVSSSEAIAKHVAGLFDRSKQSICSSTILSEDILLTAAHCIADNPRNMVVVFGTRFSRSAVTRRVVSARKAPAWSDFLRRSRHARTTEEIDAIHNWGDIAIVKFSGGLPAGFKTTKVLTSLSSLRDGQLVTLAGYGLTNGRTNQGSGTLRKVDATMSEVRYTRTEVLIDQRNGRGACRGDSGGPSFVKVDGEYAVFGVTSRGVRDHNLDCTQFAAYTAVETYWNWIVDEARGLSQFEIETEQAAGF